MKTVLVASTLVLTAGQAAAQLVYAAAVGSSASSGGDASAAHADRCQAAVDLAIIAADCGLMDVSLEAVRRACADGPPVSAVDLGGILSSGPTRNPSTNRNIADRQGEADRAALAKRLIELDKAWQDSEVEAEVVFEIWKELVLPPSRPSEAFVYSTAQPRSSSRSYSNVQFDREQPKPVDCGAGALVSWAERAGEANNLRAAVDERRQMPSAAEACLLLRALLAVAGKADSAELQELIADLQARPQVLISGPDAELLFGYVWPALEKAGIESAAVQELLTAVVEATRGDDQWTGNQWAMYVVTRRVRDAIDRGDQEAFVLAASRLLSQYDQLRPNNASYVASCEARFYSQCSNRAFEKGRPELGLYCLKTQSLLPSDQRYGGPDLADLLAPTKSVCKALLEMSPQQRWDIFEELVWKQPDLGLWGQSRLSPTGGPPPLFLPEQVPADQVTRRDSACCTVLEWTMRDALAAGKRAELEEKIAEFEARKTDDAALPRLVLQMAMEEPVDLASLIKENEDGQPMMSLPRPANAQVTAFELELARQGLQNPETHDASLAYAEQLYKRAVDRNHRTMMPWLQALIGRARGAQGSDGSAPSGPLAHWASADDANEAYLRAGRYPHVEWRQNADETLRHDASSDESYLFLRYPLAGEFSVTWESEEGDYAEGGVVWGGTFCQFLEYNQTINFRTIGGRASDEAKTKSLKNNAVNAYKLVSSDQGVTVSINGEETHPSICLPGVHPFFSLASFSFRTPSFTKIRFDGEPRIPREVSLVSPQMLGWTGTLKGDPLPPLQFKDEQLDRADQKEDSPIPHWDYVDGEIQSVDLIAAHAARSKAAESDEPDDPDPDADEPTPYEEKRREALLRYMRPLCDGEQISLEFFYEPGKFSLAPAVGRIAVLLDGQAPRLHWISNEIPDWTGVSVDNQVEDPDAKLPSPVQLASGDWNRLIVRRDAGEVTLTLNDAEVYRRAWEDQAGSQFGLFHDPTQFHIRVRNAKLSGDWPESLPENLLERRSENAVD